MKKIWPTNQVLTVGIAGRRHDIQESCWRAGFLSQPLCCPDAMIETDERYQNAGEKATNIPIQFQQTRRRANKEP